MAKLLINVTPGPEHPKRAEPAMPAKLVELTPEAEDRVLAF